MSTEIIFEKSKYKPKRLSNGNQFEVGSMVKLLIDKKVISGKKQALFLTLIIILLLISVSVYLLYKSVNVRPAIINPSFLKSPN